MSASSEKTKAEDAATSGSDQDNRATPFLKFCRWAAPSFRNPENFPHFLIAVFTLFLAVFAFFAWRESQEGTAALQGQLNELKRQSELTISQLRPKLTLTIGGPNHPMKVEDKEGWMMTPIWENHGGSEGINFWGWDAGRLFTPDAPKDFDFINLGHDTGPISKTPIGLNDPRFQLSKFISRDDVQSVVDRKATYVLWGYVEYQESLPGNRAHHIHWCYGTVPVDAGDSYIFSHALYRPECNTSD
jgi:hypothetical protein